ncbi:ribonuclease E [Exilibacterium tricleocarpae]|uniref:Ribonuclease E n=1 Tax=Exilibacterium tricleocarpae TaxID=2591008 RepID=A0A545TQJ8_9GAMM|nr:di-heme-cytochrome C peroxidase [Exilibacterium tricleocarpae]TQV79503.1 ribonuclease E [Exilibacterium tricleocarpae]
MSTKPLSKLLSALKKNRRYIAYGMLAVVASMFISLAAGKIYQNWDDDPDRGAIAIDNGAFGESYQTPVYLEQGWKPEQSLWFYNTTQGSALLPYDLFIALEQKDSDALFRSALNMDEYRYLPQKPTFFNPDGLPVGMVKDTYQGKDYMGFTCAACHTGQVNYKGRAIRIDGGPAMADMVTFLHDLDAAMQAALQPGAKQQRFVEAVLALENNYDSKQQVLDSLAEWQKKVQLYNIVNHSRTEYGYARLDAFGRIYNRVLQHVLNKEQARELLAMATNPAGGRILTIEQVDKVLEGVDETIIRDGEFSQIITRLMSTEDGYPGLNLRQLLTVRNALFNEPNAPVSYPFLWDIAQSDYVQWNGIANNADVGPLGRNTGEVIGVFGILDWEATDTWFSISGWLTGQVGFLEAIKDKLASLVSGQDGNKTIVDFKSSINLVNLQRLESHLKSLKSPQWPEDIFGKIDRDKAARGELIYAERCQSCHEIIDRNDWNRVVIGKMDSIDVVGTDPTMAVNSVSYTGRSGHFKHTYQPTGVGDTITQGTAPVAEILTVVTKGVVATPDPDKWLVRRWLDWMYTLGMSFFDNEIKPSIKQGNYQADTTANPYQSLLSYKARSLNGIWATAPYLHNGSVPTLYDLLLPKKRADDPEEGAYRPDEFMVGSREYDPVKMGFRYEGFDGFSFKTFRAGDLNSGHEYAAARTERADGKQLKPLTEQQRWDLIEFLKTL